MSKLTIEQMIAIIQNKQIDQCDGDDKAQVMAFAFGEEFIASDHKGDKATYEATINLSDSRTKFLVQWLEGYGDVQPQVVPIANLLNNDEWGLSHEFLCMLNEMAEGQTHDYHDLSGVIRFQKAPTL